MHLWPTKNLRDSFKLSYLKNLEWNYRRMEQQDQQQRQSSAAEQKLLENEDRDGDTPKPLKRGEEACGVVASLCHELLLILSCCYCCFCCGACVEEK